MFRKIWDQMLNNQKYIVKSESFKYQDARKTFMVSNDWKWLIQQKTQKNRWFTAAFHTIFHNKIVYSQKKILHSQLKGATTLHDLARTQSPLQNHKSLLPTNFCLYLFTNCLCRFVFTFYKICQALLCLMEWIKP